jgi:translation initiation factor 1
MRERSNSKTVYSTATGRICAGCGWPDGDCRCSSRAATEEPVPARVVAKLRLEKKGRGGKSVTVVHGLPRNTVFLKELTQALKRGCGTGGVTTEDGIELQGDLRERLRELLEKRGYLVKG